MPSVPPIWIVIPLGLLSLLGVAIGALVVWYLNRQLLGLAKHTRCQQYRTAITIAIYLPLAISAFFVAIYSDVLVISNLAIYAAIPIVLISLFTLQLWRTSV